MLNKECLETRVSVEPREVQSLKIKKKTQITKRPCSVPTRGKQLPCAGDVSKPIVFQAGAYMTLLTKDCPLVAKRNKYKHW